MLARFGAAALLLAALLPAASYAEQPTLAPSPALTCLTLKPGKSDRIEYPADLLARKDGGTVPVELVFSAPDEAPRVKVLDKSAFDGLVDAVEEHVSRFRVPCMPAGDGPVTLRQTYVFTPNDGRKVMASSMRDVADAARNEQLHCMTHLVPGSIPDYPTEALRQGEQGNFYVRLRFSAKDQEPAVEWLTGTRRGLLLTSVARFVAGLRVPCLTGGPIEVNILYQFRIDGGSRTVLRDMTLRDLLGAAKDLPLPVYFDFSTMACPFDLRLTYHRPYSANVVKELEQSHPARKTFLDWLSGVTLNLSETTSLAILGDEFTVSVPCGRLDL